MWSGIKPHINANRNKTTKRRRRTSTTRHTLPNEWLIIEANRSKCQDDFHIPWQWWWVLNISSLLTWVKYQTRFVVCVMSGMSVYLMHLGFQILLTWIWIWFNLLELFQRDFLSYQIFYLFVLFMLWGMFLIQRMRIRMECHIHTQRIYYRGILWR